MATSRTATGKRTTVKTANSTAVKKPLTRKTAAVKPATESSTPARKKANTPAKKTAVTVAKKPSVPKAEKTVVAAKGTPRKPAKKSITSPEERYQMISTAAYYLAEQRGFSGCYEMDDWITAEAEIDAQLNA